jgi:V8-like Glu-specific endopeptidase
MHTSRRLTAACLAMLLTVSVSAHRAEAVTYGNPVENPTLEYPEVVPVWFTGGMCTGTLIEQQVVLTAAHCIYGQTGPFQISVGGRDLSSGTRIDVNATWYHPRYDEDFSENDVGLLHLTKPAGVARLASLPRSRTASKPAKFTLVGWGKDQNGRQTGKLSSLRLNNYEAFTRAAYKTLYNSKTMIGAGRFFKSEVLFGGACTGDSGGPLYKGTQSREIAGITSWGSAKGCTVYRPSVFVRVPYHLRTIRTAVVTLKARAQQNPITGGTSSGKPGLATMPVPTTTTPAPTTTRPAPTTTTTAPPPPLTVSYLTATQSGWWSNTGQRGEFTATADVVKWCFTLNGAPLPDYRYVTGKSFTLNAEETPTQSGGVGCYENTSYYGNKKVARAFGPSGLDSGIHSLSVTAYDIYGRSASSPEVTFNGQINSDYDDFYPGSITKRSRTGEIELRAYATNSRSNYYQNDSYVTKVCYRITRDSVAVTDMTSGSWPLVEPNCVANPSPTPASTNESSGVISDPAGTQTWGVVATIYNSQGKTIETDSYWFQS